MKKNLKMISIILLILLIIIGIFFGVKLYLKELKEKNLNNKDWIEKNVKLVDSDINDNVLKVSKDKDIKIYNMLYQKVIDEMIGKQSKASINDPFIVYNPYGTNNNSINFYFKTDNKVKVSYKIEVDGFNDFSKTLKGGYSKNHSYQLIGFIMGYKNVLTLTLTDENGKSEDYIYNLDFTNYSNAKQTKLKVTKKLDDELSNGLFAILGDSSDVQDYVHLYDNDGVLRSEIPINGYRAVNLLFKDDDMYFSISETKMVRVGNLGMVEKKYDLKNYKLHHDYTFDEDGNLLILTSDTNSDSCEDEIIKLDTESGDILDSFSLEEVFKDVRESAYYNKAEVAKEVESVGVDWMHINTINYLGDDTVILSSRETSSIIKLSNIFDNPKIDYIIGDESFWKNYDEKDYLLTKIGNFTHQGGQHTVTYEKTSEDGVYYLSMFNNNIGISTTVPDFDWSKIGLTYSSPKDDGKSYYYKYKVDENKGTYELVQKFEVPYSAYMSSVQSYGSHIIVDSAQACTYSERNSDGDVIRSYKVKCESSVYRVFKYDFSNLFD